MSRNLCCILGAIVTLSLFFHCRALASEELILKVTVNTMPKGDFFVLLTSDQDIQMKLEDFKKLGIQDPERYPTVEGTEYISLKSLHPDLTFTLNERELTLEMMTDPSLLGKTILDRYPDRPEVTVSDGNSAFFNYAFNYTTGKHVSDLGTFNLATEIGTRFKGFLSLGTFNYNRTPTEERYVRLNNSIIKDDQTNLRRWTLWDSTGIGGRLGSIIPMGGINVSKNFSMVPQFVRHPLPTLQGTVGTPSEIEIYQGGFVVQKERLPPGKFVFQDLPVTSGLGHYDVVITDAFGREEVISNPYYIDPTLLKEGIHDYSYTFGFEREAFGLENFQYGDPVFLVFHNYGLSDQVNVGFGAEASRDLINFGPTGALLLGKAGLLSLTGAYSNTEGTNGFAGLLTHSFVSKLFSANFRLRAFSRDYATISTAESDDKQQLDASLGLGVGLGPWGSLSGRFSIQKNYSDQETRRYSLSYSRQMTKNTSLLLSTGFTRGSETSNSLFAGLHVSLGGKVSASLSHSTTDNSHTESIKFQRNAPEGEGFGYRLAVDRLRPGDEKASTESTTSLQYSGRYQNYTAEYLRGADTETGSVSVSGGVAAIGGSLHFSRPVTDSFGLVRVGKQEGVEVKFNNHKIGKTNSRGEILVPNMLPFNDNKIEINNKDIPINYSIERVSEHVYPPFRGGTVVDFKVVKLQGIIGTISSIVEGKRKPVERGLLEVWVMDHVVESPIAKGGEFYLENIPPGTHKGTVSDKAGQCNVEITIPESDVMILDLGNLTCGESPKKGSTTGKKNIRLPNTPAFRGHTIEVKSKSAPFDSSKEKSVAKKAPPSLVTKKASHSLAEAGPKLQKHHVVIGNISYAAKGITKAVRFKKLQIVVMDKVIDLPIAEDGEFYLENIPSGAHRGSAFSNSAQCDIIIIVPESKDALIDVGGVDCEARL